GNAAAVAAGMGARVSVLDTDLARLRRLDTAFHGRIATLASNAAEIERTVLDADLVIGSVLVPGARAPKLVTTELVARMRPGAVLVDIAIDQGGCFEGSHPTTHAAPTFPVAGALYYCVANMPGAVPHTATLALNRALTARRAGTNPARPPRARADPAACPGCGPRRWTRCARRRR